MLFKQAMKLIQEGVYFNAPDSSRDDCLPIHTACKAGNMAMLNTLIEMGKREIDHAQSSSSLSYSCVT